MSTSNTFIPIADKLLDFYCLRKSTGLYVEAGCNDGVQQSNTFAFEKKGWKGWLIDASPRALEKCKQSRCGANTFINAVLSGPENEGKALLGDFDGHLMGSVGGTRLNRTGTIPVKAMTISNLVKEYNIPDMTVDLFVLDVEGHELEVLKGWTREPHFYPKVVVIEITGDVEPVRDIMRTRGYYLTDNLSNFNLENNPAWDGSHQDYIFERVGDCWD